MAQLSIAKGGMEDWTAPDYFEESAEKEQRFLPLFLRQLLPSQSQRTRLTLTGWFLIVVAMGIGSAAYNTASNILFMTLALVLSSLILSGVLSLFNFSKLRWELSGPNHARVGDTCLSKIALENRKRVLPSMSLRFLLMHSGSDRTERVALHHALGARGASQMDYTFTPTKRGAGYVKLLGAESEFPFGFLTKLLRAEQTAELIVWPAPVEYTFLKQSGGQRYLGGESRRRAGVGSDLLNIRPYVPGDAPRLFHWKATARLGKPMTRQLAQDGEQGYWIEIETHAERWDADSFEVMCSVTCALAADLYHLGRLDGIWFAGVGLVAVRSLGDLHECFDRIALLERTADQSRQSASSKQSKVYFRPNGSEGVSIYIDANKAGQTEH